MSAVERINRPVSRHVPADVMAELMLTREAVCVNCGSINGPFELDHAQVPFSVKPIHEAWNLQLLCQKCNRKKGASMPKIYVDLNKLHPHQNDFCSAAKEYPFTNELTGERNALLGWLATSSGKTIVCLTLPFELGSRRTLVIAPGKITAKRFNEEWSSILGTIVIGKVLPKNLPVLSGAAKAGHESFAKNSPIVIATIQWIMNRLDSESTRGLLQEFDTVIIDEGHHMAAEDWGRIIAFFNKAKIVLLTGTPKRHDGKPLPGIPSRYLRTDSRGRKVSSMLDVADVTGHMGARYTLRDAWRDKRIKHPQDVYVEGKELSGTLLGDNADVTADTIDAYMDQVAASGHRLDPTRSALITKLALTRAREVFLSHKAKHRGIGKKMTAICKVRETDNADRVAEIARAVGWNAVSYHGTTSSDVSALAMDRRLSEFESDTSDVDLIVQDKMLTEGYNNPSICMSILLCKLDSDSEIEQFFGRGLRLWPDVPHDKTPRLLLFTLNWAPLVEKVKEYIRMATDLTHVEARTMDRGGDGETGEPCPLATLDEGELYFVDPQWTEYVKTKDPVRLFVDTNVDGAAREEVERLIRSGELSINGYEPNPRTPEAPLDHVAAELAWNQRRKEISGFLYRNTSDLRAETPEGTYQGVIGKALGSAINEMFPGIKGGFTKNKSLDLEQLRLFLTCDLEPVKRRALAIARRMF